MVTFIKANEKFLDQNLEIIISDLFINKVNIRNVAAYFRLAHVFHLEKLVEFTLRYIERCFPMIVETAGFSQLDHTRILKILASSEVRVSSEVEIFAAADRWMSYDFQARSRFAQNILMKIRLPLLSPEALKGVLCNSSSFLKVETCKALIDEILRNTSGFYQTKSKIYYLNRYCSQKSFNITFVKYNGTNDYYNTEEINIKSIDGNDFENINVLTQIPDNTKGYLRRWMKDAVYTHGAIYHIGNFTNDPGGDCSFQMPIFTQKYSLLTDTLSEMIEADMYDLRSEYCVCAFMHKIYVIGGVVHDDVDEFAVSDICTEFDVKTEQWRKVACINEPRRNAAAAVFQGQVVVSGGWQYDEGELSNTVEVYNHAADKWTYMPNMISGCYFHSLVAVRSKLFAVGYHNQVYDSFTRKFVSIEPPERVITNFVEFFDGISMGDKLELFEWNSTRVTTYDVDEETWSVEPFTPITCYPRCLKIPKL